MNIRRTVFPFIVLACFLFVSANAFSQDWKWAFSAKGTSYQTELLATDKYNNSYFAVYYNDTLIVNGQSYYHEQWMYNYNCLLIKLDKQGNLLKKTDFYMPNTVGGSMMGMKAAADSAGNIYVGGEFSVRMFVGDTVINHLPLPYYESPSTYMLKFDSSFDMKWAKVMGCEHYVYFQNIAVRHNQLYYSVSPHSWSSSNPTILYCFGQDTLYFAKDMEYAVYFNLDFDGNIVSHTTIHGNNSWIPEEIIAENNDRYLIGGASDTLFYENKPIFVPDTAKYWQQYILRFNGNDSLTGVTAIVTNSQSYIEIVAANANDELFFRANDTQGLSIGQDTIPSAFDGTSIIGKLDARRNISWYESLAGIGPAAGIYMAQMHDTLYAACALSYFLIMGDTIINNPGGMYENYILGFAPDGALLSSYSTNTTGDSHPTGLGFDNCENILLTGTFQGNAYYGNDTLVGLSTGSKSDVFIAYLSNFRKDIDLGRDTLACGQYVIPGPPGWDHYSWNQGTGNQKDLLVTETGRYKLRAWTDKCCSMEDSVNVTILPLPITDLGKDTTLKQSHSMALSVPAGYDKYKWSTGAESNSIVLVGSQLTVGFHTIWCESTNNICSSTDTLLVEVIDDYGISELPEINIRITPNPFSDRFSVSCDKPVQEVQVLDCSGKRLSTFCAAQEIAQPLMLTLPYSGNHLLILKIETGEGIYYKKVLQLKNGN
jgi:hypothetical protein